jgi:DNA-binding IclR family transcriptional regulator
LLGNTGKQSATANDSGDDRYHLQILSRAIGVLFAFSARRPQRTLDELAAELELSKTSLLRILRTLEGERFLLRSDDHYRLGPRVLDLGNVFLSTLSVHKVAQPFMSALAQRCGQTVSLGILDGFEVVYIAIEQAQREVGIQGEIGGRHPAHATGLGKVMLADLDAEALDALLDAQELKRLTHRTIVDPALLRERLRQVDKDGFAVDEEERGIGIRCVAAPIRDHRGQVIAAISLAGPIFHMTDDVLPDFQARLIDTARALSEALGYSEAQLVG